MHHSHSRSKINESELMVSVVACVVACVIIVVMKCITGWGQEYHA